MMESNSRHNKRRPPGGFLFWTILLLFAKLPGYAVDLTHCDRSAHAVWQMESTSERLRDLPAQQCKSLRKEALAQAQEHRGPLFENPAAVNGGINREALKALQQQRAYQRSHADTQLLGTKEPQLNGKRGKSALPSSSKAEKAANVECRGPGIFSVNGRTTAPAFTPQMPDNRYRIQGCFLGKEIGRVQLKIDAGDHQSSLVVTLRVVSPAAWSDREIEVELDPTLSGLPDYNDHVTLQVITAKQELLEMPACRFVALRAQPQLLRFIPSSWVKLGATAHRLRPGEVEFLSPPPGDIRNARDASALILRSGVLPFPTGQDGFDFRRLLNGWVVHGVELESYAVPCPGEVLSLHASPAPDLQWDGPALRVIYQASGCSSRLPPDYGFNMSVSLYALKIWVVGPLQTEFMHAGTP